MEMIIVKIFLLIIAVVLSVRIKTFAHAYKNGKGLGTNAYTKTNYTQAPFNTRKITGFIKHKDISAPGIDFFTVISKTHKEGYRTWPTARRLLLFVIFGYSLIVAYALWVILFR